MERSAILLSALLVVFTLSITPAVQADILTVTKTEDTDDGVCDGDCSLREAIAAASAGDGIEIPTGTYTLTLGSELVIDEDLTLTGSGAGSTIIQAAAEPGGADYRVLQIATGNVAISNITIRHGKNNVYGDAGGGGGIHNSGTLTLTNSTVSNNSAPSRFGGGIRNLGTLTILNCTVSHNPAYSGGGVYNSSTLAVTNSTVSGNSASSSRGGGIANYGGTVTLINSTVSQNSAFKGWGIFNRDGTTTLTNTIIADNFSSSTWFVSGDCDAETGGSVISLGHNLDGGNRCGPSGPGDLSGVSPLLGPLQDNGGPTFTHALLEGSPGINVGDDNTAPETDQRGYGRNGVADIGAFEFDGIPPGIVLAISVYLPEREGVPINRSHGVPVSVDDVSGKGFTSLQAVLTYDGSIIRPLGLLTNGTLTEGWAVDFNVLPGMSPDTLKIAMATSQDTLSGSGELFAINVEAVEGVSVGDTTVLHFERFRFNEETDGVDAQDGVVYIGEAIRLLGDVTNNGVVTAYDASHILQHTVGLLTWTGEDSVVAEVSGDGTISALDASLVLRYVIQKIMKFPVEGGPQAKVAYATRTVRMGEMEALADGRMCLPLTIDEMEGVVSGEMTLSFEGDAGDAAVRSTDLTSDYLLVHNVRDGRILVSFAGAESGAGPGPVLEVVFDASDAGLLSSLRLERVSLNEGRIPVRIEGVESRRPTAYRLAQNHPNPFNPETIIRYDVAKTGDVRLSVYALTGQLVRTLVDRECAAGSYSVVWDGTDHSGRAVASGLYLCRMISGDYRAVRKMVLMR